MYFVFFISCTVRFRRIYKKKIILHNDWSVRLGENRPDRSPQAFGDNTHLRCCRAELHQELGEPICVQHTASCDYGAVSQRYAFLANLEAEI